MSCHAGPGTHAGKHSRDEVVGACKQRTAPRHRDIAYINVPRQTGLLRPTLPDSNPDQLVMVWSKVNVHRNDVSPGDYLDWKSQNGMFQGLVAWTNQDFNLTISDHPQMLPARVTTPGFFNLQGMPFLFGREFLASEGEAGNDHVAIITRQLWEERFGADPKILGQNL